MKALQIITALCIASNFSLYSMKETNTEKKIAQFTALKGSRPDLLWLSCSALPWRKNNQDCIIINAYLLLNRFPNNSVEEQTAYYEKLLSDTTQKLDWEVDYRKKTNGKVWATERILEEKKLYQESKVAEIQQANFSGNIQDKENQDKFNTSVDNIVTSRFLPTRFYNWQLQRLHERIEFQQFLGTPYPSVINNSND
jgi:hypothetical protein